MTNDGRNGPRAPASAADPLERLHLDGAIFLRGEYSERWALADQGGTGFAGAIHPGADHVTLFHVIADGRCWVSVAGGERHWATSGEVIVIPYGERHTLGGVEDAEPVSMTSVVAPPPWQEMPVIRHGGGGRRTDMVCGYLYSEDPLFDPRLRALPPVVVVSPPEGPAAEWVNATIAYALDGSTSRQAASIRLPETLLIEVLRLYMATNPAADRGWLAALHDPVLAPAMALIHSAPQEKWTVSELAREIGTSRSLLDSRFRDGLGRSPIRYLTDWRMHLASDLLRGTEASVGSIARRVGYDSHEAFSRAFKRSHGHPPSAWRHAGRGSGGRAGRRP